MNERAKTNAKTAPCELLIPGFPWDVRALQLVRHHETANERVPDTAPQAPDKEIGTAHLYQVTYALRVPHQENSCVARRSFAFEA